jgi:hypothetical protein
VLETHHAPSDLEIGDDDEGELKLPAWFRAESAVAKTHTVEHNECRHGRRGDPPPTMGALVIQAVCRSRSKLRP